MRQFRLLLLLAVLLPLQTQAQNRVRSFTDEDLARYRRGESHSNAPQNQPASTKPQLAISPNQGLQQNLEDALKYREPYRYQLVLDWVTGLRKTNPQVLQEALDAMLGQRTLSAEVLQLRYETGTQRVFEMDQLTKVEVQGGQSIPEVEQRLYSRICNDAFCKLTNITKSEISAAELFLIQIRFGYTVTLFKPIPPQLVSAARKRNLTEVVIPSNYQIHYMSRTLWEAPPALHRMKTLATISVFNEASETTSYHVSGMIMLSDLAFGTRKRTYDMWTGAGWSEEALKAADIEEYIYTYSGALFAHELAHAFDDTIIQKTAVPGHGLPLSYQSAWSELSQWQRQSGTSEERDVQGFSHIPCSTRSGYVDPFRPWESTSPLDRFIDSYALKNPKEDFAQHAASFIFYPYVMKDNIGLSGKYDYFTTIFAREYERKLLKIQTKCRKN